MFFYKWVVATILCKLFTTEKISAVLHKNNVYTKNIFLRKKFKFKNFREKKFFRVKIYFHKNKF